MTGWYGIDLVNSQISWENTRRLFPEAGLEAVKVWPRQECQEWGRQMGELSEVVKSRSLRELAWQELSGMWLSLNVTYTITHLQGRVTPWNVIWPSHLWCPHLLNSVPTGAIRWGLSECIDALLLSASLRSPYFSVCIVGFSADMWQLLPTRPVLSALHRLAQSHKSPSCTRSY